VRIVIRLLVTVSLGRLSLNQQGTDSAPFDSIQLSPLSGYDVLIPAEPLNSAAEQIPENTDAAKRNSNTCLTLNSSTKDTAYSR
jgi:hypothetical protein